MEMAELYTYQKKRFDFGRHAGFEDTEIKIVGFGHNDERKERYIEKNPNRVVLDNIPV